MKYVAIHSVISSSFVPMYDNNVTVEVIESVPAKGRNGGFRSKLQLNIQDGVGMLATNRTRNVTFFGPQELPLGKSNEVFNMLDFVVKKREVVCQKHGKDGNPIFFTPGQEIHNHLGNLESDGTGEVLTCPEGVKIPVTHVLQYFTMYPETDKMRKAINYANYGTDEQMAKYGHLAGKVAEEPVFTGGSITYTEVKFPEQANNEDDSEEGVDF